MMNAVGAGCAAGTVMGARNGSLSTAAAGCGFFGLGQLLVDSVSKRDLPVVQGASLLFAMTYVLLNLTADVLSILTNPRLLHPR